MVAMAYLGTDTCSVTVLFTFTRWVSGGVYLVGEGIVIVIMNVRYLIR